MSWFWKSSQPDEDDEEEYVDEDDELDESAEDSDEGDEDSTSEEGSSDEETANDDNHIKESHFSKATKEIPDTRELEQLAVFQSLELPSAPTLSSLEEESENDDAGPLTEDHSCEHEEDDTKKLGNVERHSIPKSVSMLDENTNDFTANNGQRASNSNGMSKDDSSKRVIHVEAVQEERAHPSNGDHDDDTVVDDVNSTSQNEKQSLLALAAEHDRVDILQAILTKEMRPTLLDPCGNIPPLHIAVMNGSVNAVNCLLRMGGDPSIRPNVSLIVAAIPKEENTLEVSSLMKYDGRTAWEIAFGVVMDNGNGTMSNHNNIIPASPPATSSWNPFSSSGPESPSLFKRMTSPSSSQLQVADMPPSKREGIRHAFTAEALRCIGSDDVVRLQQLLDSNMPASIDIGGKSLYDWAIEMGAAQCEQILRPAEAAKYPLNEEQPLTNTVLSGDDSDSIDETELPLQRDTKLQKQTSFVVHRPASSEISGLSLLHLLNRLDELESLARALSISLDALAEEASVCNGLLLMGGGASALAAHVRSLKATKERKLVELSQLEEAWENSEDELAYWVREGGREAEQIAEKVMAPQTVMHRQPSLQMLDDDATEEEQLQQRRQACAQIAASEHKICKLRASIADLSEVRARDLVEVEQRGLSGGVTLVRGLRDEIRDIDFALAEIKSADAACRTKISLVQTRIRQNKKDSNGVSGTHRMENTQTATSAGRSLIPTATSTNGNIEATTDSQRIATGQSTALALRNGNQRHGFFNLTLWEIIMRIIGFRNDNDDRQNGYTSPVLIV